METRCHASHPGVSHRFSPGKCLSERHGSFQPGSHRTETRPQSRWFLAILRGAVDFEQSRCVCGTGSGR